MAASSSHLSAASPLVPNHQSVVNPANDDDDSGGYGALGRTRGAAQQPKWSPVRNLSLANGIAIVLGLQIGAGIFISPSLVAREAGSKTVALLIWAAAGVITWACAACYIELGTRLPYNGGVQEYLAFCFNERASFVVSWAMVFTVNPCSSAVLALLIATYLSDALALEGLVSDVVSNTVAVAIAVLVTVVNCVSNKLTFAVANGLLACKIIGVGFILVMGLVDYIHPKRLTVAIPKEPVIFPAPSASNITDAILSALWAFMGWETVGYVAGELKDPGRTIPLVMNISMVVAILLFLLTNISYLTTLPFESVVASTSIGLTFSLHFFRRAGAVLYVVVIWLSGLGSLNIKIFTAGRLTQAAAERQYLPAMTKTVRKDSGGESDDDKASHRHDGSMSNVLVRFWRRPVRYRDGSIPLAGNIFNFVLTTIYILAGDLGSLVVFIGLVSFSVTFTTILGLLRLRLFPHHHSDPTPLPSSTPSPQPSLKRAESHDISSPYDRSNTTTTTTTSTTSTSSSEGKNKTKAGYTVPIIVILLALAATGAIVSISAVRHPIQSIGFVIFCVVSATLVFPHIHRNSSSSSSSASAPAAGTTPTREVERIA